MAAGGSRRLNSPKQLLKWQGDYLINHIVGTVSASKIDAVTIILGSNRDTIQPLINEQKVKFIENPCWESGLSSSIKCGVASLEDGVEGVFIILVDQPFITSDLLDEMITIFESTNAEIIAPRVGQRQCNPVLFRKSIFPELMQISGDKGAKSLLNIHGVEWLDWHDRNLLLDIDSEEDYQTALAKLAE